MNRQRGRVARIERWRDSAFENPQASENFGGSKQGDIYRRKSLISESDENQYFRRLQEK